MAISVTCAYLLPSIDTVTISLNKVYAVPTTAAHRMMSMVALDERLRCFNNLNFSNQRDLNLGCLSRGPASDDVIFMILHNKD